MKKKILIGLSVFSLFFFLGGIYIIAAIEGTTSTLDNLLRLHQVEILREQLLIQIKRVQADLYLKNTRHARGVDRIVHDVRQMEHAAQACFTCHHEGDVLARLVDLRREIDSYKDALSRVLTIRANVRRLEAEEDAAFRTGEELIEEVDAIIAMTRGGLERKTHAGLGEIARTKIILYALVASGPLLAIALAFVFLRGFARPVQALLDATRRLKSGDLDHRIMGLRDEFGEVAASFNEMAASLKEQMRQMQRAEQMTMVGQMATGLAHEIKNPLAGIKASMQVLSEEESLPDEDRSVLLKVIDEVQRIETLIKGLLNFARPPKPQFVTVDVNHILDAAISFSLRYPALSSNGGHEINVVRAFQDHIPPTMADPMQLQQIFLNLILNATDAMPDGGTLTVKTFHDASANAIQIEMCDTGKGMDEMVMAKIFQPFFTTKPRGTGLGLAISKQLIEQHGGSISATKNPGGAGTLFRIVLPRQEGGEVQTT